MVFYEANGNFPKVLERVGPNRKTDHRSGVKKCPEHFPRDWDRQGQICTSTFKQYYSKSGGGRGFAN